MSKTEELKQQIADLNEILNATGQNEVSKEEKEALKEGISELEKQLSAENSKSKTSPKTKQEKKKKTKNVEKAKTPDCDELAEAWKKRMSAVKKASGKKTQPILKIIGNKMEGAVKSAIAYNKTQGGDMDIKALKDAVKTLSNGFDKLKYALKGEFEDLYIDKFKEDLMKIINALEKKQK